MQTLPEDQDKLVQQLNKLDHDEKNKVIPERRNINFFLIVWSSILAPIFFAFALYYGDIEYISSTNILIISLIGIVSFIAAYFNKTWGFFFTCIATLGIDFYVTMVNPFHHSELIIMLDAFTLFNITGQFFGKGYIVGGIIIFSKLLLIFFLFPNDRAYSSLIYPIVNIATIGIIPFLIHNMYSEARKAKKETIRASILAMQNQDLLASWQEYFNKDAKPVVQNPVADTQPPAQSGYVSPYGNSNI